MIRHQEEVLFLCFQHLFTVLDNEQIFFFFCVCTFCFHCQSILFVCELFSLRLPDARSALTTFYIYFSDLFL